MGAVDLVIQVESPTSVARGLQRVGRAGHQVGAPSKGVIFPKYRGDLLECAIVTRRMHEGAIETTQIPRVPLDVLAQQIVAMTVMDRWTVDELLAALSRAAPYETLSREVLEGVLGMLAGAYPSDEFAELKPRVVWDRVADTVEGRRDARVVAVTSGGTIPDRGLFGVFMVGEAGTPGRRVGELDEEMVYELRAGMHGDVVILGASSWRVEEISHDRVTVSPAPGVPGKLPFWKGDAIGRPMELGRAMGAFVARARGGPDARRAAVAPRQRALLRETHDLDELAASNLLAYLDDEREATGALPTDQRIVVERFRDELGDWRLCLLTPFGGRVHAPWSLALEARIGERLGLEVQTIWSDDGIAIRLPEGDAPLDGIEALLFPDPEEVEDLVVGRLASSTLFASRFRENAARALLLPRRRPGTRTPLWQQRQRAADLLAVASRYGSFPILVETYRECLLGRVRPAGVAGDPGRRRPSRDRGPRRGDGPGVAVREQPAVRLRRRLHVRGRRATRRAPGRRAHARPRSVARAARPGGAARAARSRGARRPRAERPGADRGPPGDDDRSASTTSFVASAISRPTRLPRGPRAAPRSRRAVAGGARRDAPGGPRPDRGGRPLDRHRGRGAVPRRCRHRAAGRRPGRIPGSGRRRARRPAGALGAVSRPVRHARTGGTLGAAGRGRRGRSRAVARVRARSCAASSGRAVPSASGAIPDILRLLRRRSLARLRREVEPVDPAALARFVPDWHGIAPIGAAAPTLRGSAALERLAEVVDQLAGVPIPASVLERDVLPARIPGYQPRLLDELGSLGEVGVGRAWQSRPRRRPDRPRSSGARAAPTARPA